MKIIVISMINRLLSGAIIRYLRERGEMMPIQVANPKKIGEPYSTCKVHKADMLLMETQAAPYFTLEERLETAKILRETLPDCKVAILCDENVDPDAAERVKEAKKLGLIDSFFYSSVSGEYLSAMLDAL